MLEAFPRENTWKQTFYDARMGTPDVIDYNEFYERREVLQCFLNMELRT